MFSSCDSRQNIVGDSAAILESISDAFFALDADWRFTYVNREAETILGSAPGELLGKDLWTTFPGVIGSQFEAAYRKAAQEGETTTLTAFYPDHDRWYEARVYPGAQGISIYFKNVTERILADERLRESELRFRLMADAIPQIVWITDAQGRAEFFNRQWSVYTGQPFEPTTAQIVADNFVHPEDQAHTMAAWHAAMRAGHTFVVEHRIRSATGEYRWFLVRAEAYRDPQTGEILRWFGTSTDVHNQKLAESSLRESEARYRRLFESIDEGFCIIQMLFDGDGKPIDYRFCEVNAIFEKQTGMHAPVGKTALELVPQLEQHWFDIYGRVAVTGEPIRFENEARSMGRWFDVYAFRIDEPAARRVALLFKDITERRRIEQELQLGDRRKDEFLAMLAHELRNPLAPIASAADLLRLGRLDDARVKQTSEIISRQVRHMTGLIDDLLDVSRVTRGLVTLELATLDVKRIVANAVEQARPLIEVRRHHFAVHMAPESAYVLGDKKRLVQVITNLLNNAAKYTPEGGSISLKMDVQGEQVLLAVTDNGIGMEPDLVKHVFELFSQAERTSDRSQGGLGIGLALVKSLVELHSGSVFARSAGAGTGSEFTVCLPRIAQPDETPMPRQADLIETSPKNLRVMVVEDNPDAARMLAMFLESAGYTVAVEHDATEVLARARIEKPDVFLLDIGLPEIDGYQLAHRLRSQPETAKTVLIAITGYGQEQDKQSAAAAGFDHHFVKPVDTAGLAALLAKLSASKAA